MDTITDIPDVLMKSLLVFSAISRPVAMRLLCRQSKESMMDEVTEVLQSLWAGQSEWSLAFRTNSRSSAMSFWLPHGTQSLC